MPINFPLMTVVDDAGSIVSGATVTISGVTDIDGVAISSPGAIVHQAGPNVAVAYDAETKGEAWITLAISKVGSTFTGLNASPAFFLSTDPAKVAAVADGESGLSCKAIVLDGSTASLLILEAAPGFTLSTVVDDYEDRLVKIVASTAAGRVGCDATAGGWNTSTMALTLSRPFKAEPLVGDTIGLF